MLCAADLCGCDVDDLIESDSDDESHQDLNLLLLKDRVFNRVEGTSIKHQPCASRLHAEFWRQLWSGVGGLPLKDGISVWLAGTNPEMEPDPSTVFK